MTGPAPYDPIASFYDRNWGHEFAPVARAAFHTYLGPHLRPGSAVLDLCCGTGLMLAYLDRLGFRAYGVDESARMLEIARSNAAGAEVQQADMGSFSSEVRFDAVLSFCNSLNHVRSLQHLRATLANIARHLAPGGFLLFDYVLPEAFETAWEWSGQIDGHKVSYTYAQGNADCIIDDVFRIRQISISDEEMSDALSAAGLTVVVDSRIAAPRPPDGRRLVLARKQ
jgi:SAM-dependent methyltransferase